jgi:hypothetical protein
VASASPGVNNCSTNAVSLNGFSGQNGNIHFCP